MRTTLLALVVSALVLGCLGLGPDGRQPHVLRLQNDETTPVSGNVTISVEGDTLGRLPYALAPRAVEEARFGPARSGDYVFLVERDNGSPFTQTQQMGRGGWGVYVTFAEGGVRLSTLHGD